MSPFFSFRITAAVLCCALILGILPYQQIAFATPAQTDGDTTGSWTDTFAATSGSLSASSQAGINTASGAIALTKNDGSGAFTPSYYASGTVMSVTIAPLIFGAWNQLSFSVTNSGATTVKIQVYKADGTTLVSDTDLPGNSTGFTSSPVDLSDIPYSSTLGLMKLKATLTTPDTDDTPMLNSWTVSWITRNDVSDDPTPADGPWSFIGHDNRSTGQMDGTLASAYVPLWANTNVRNSTQLDFFGTPIDKPGLLTADGDVLAGNQRSVAADPYISIVLDKDTGAQKYSFTADSNPTVAGSLKQGPLRVQAVTQDNTVYATRMYDDGDGGSMATLLAMRDGELLWSRFINQGSGYSEFLTVDNSGSIVLRTPHGSITKVSSTGSTIWQKSAVFWNWAGPPSIGPNNTIYFKGSNGGFVIMSATGGTIASTTVSGGNGTPVVDTDGTSYVSQRSDCTSNGYVFKVDTAGAIVWQTSIMGGVAPGLPGMAMDEEYVYVRGECKNVVYVLNKSDGSIAKTIGDALSQQNIWHQWVAIDDSQNMLFASNRGNKEHLYSIDGVQRWTYEMPGIAGAPFGDASQWYAFWGTGAVAFKPWTVQANVGGDAVRGGSMTFSATTSMKRFDPISGEANLAQAVLEDGTIVPLSYDSTNGDGTTVWKGTYSIPSSIVDGTYSASIELAHAQVRTSTILHLGNNAPEGTFNSGISEAITYVVSSQGVGGTRGRSGTPSPAASSSSSSQSSDTASSSAPAVFAGFTDVSADDWYAPFVKKLTEAGIISGYKDRDGNPLGLFGPANNVTYAELAKMVLGVAGITVADQPGENWASPYITRAQNRGFAAYVSATFQKDAPATRGDVIVTLLEALKIPLDAPSNAYRDVRSSHPAAAAIATATRLGLVQGDTDAAGKPIGIFRPGDPVNRAEIAKILALAIEMGE